MEIAILDITFIDLINNRFVHSVIITKQVKQVLFLIGSIDMKITWLKCIIKAISYKLENAFLSGLIQYEYGKID